MTADEVTIQARITATLDKATRELASLRDLLPLAQQSVRDTRVGTIARSQAVLDVLLLKESIRTLESITQTSPGLEAAVRMLHEYRPEQDTSA